MESAVSNESATISSHISSPVLSCIPILTLVLTIIFTKELFKQFVKTYKAFIKILEQNKSETEQAATSTKLQKRFFKTKIPDLYYSRLYINCFYQDYLELQNQLYFFCDLFFLREYWCMLDSI